MSKLGNLYLSYINVRFILLLSIVLVCFSFTSQQIPTTSKLQTIVIDPGHGGKDPGTLGTKRYNKYEKHIALAVALKLGEYIANNFPEINIIYTRKEDVFLELNERTEIANKANADLFISIHCDGFTDSSVSGSSVFVMGMSKLKANLDVAMRENATIYLEDNYQKKYDGFDPKSPESYIVFSLMQNTYLEQSLKLAEMFEEQFAFKSKRKSRGVKQAPFYVISRTNMPSILVECGFLTNAKEEDYLHTKKGQDDLASSMFIAFKNYKESIELANDNLISDKKDTIITKGLKKNYFSYKLDSNEVLFKVQIGTYLNSMISDDMFANIQVEERNVNGIYKYYVASSSDKEYVDKIKIDMINRGFKGAFVVAFYQGRRISTKEALDLQMKNNNYE